MEKAKLRYLWTVFLTLVLYMLSASALAMESTCPASFITQGKLPSGESSVSVYSDTKKTERVGKLKKGVSCQVLGAEGAYYRILLEDGTEGYIQKSKLNIKSVPTEEKHTGMVIHDLSLKDYLFASPGKAKSMGIQGTIQTEVQLDSLFFHLWDERLQRAEQTIVLPVPTPAAEINISDVCKKISFPSMTAGRKTLLIQGAGAGKLLDLYETPVYVCGVFKPLRNINDQCKFTAGSNKKDGTGRAWTPSGAHPSLTVTLPNDPTAVLMTLEWRMPAESFTVEFFGANEQLISKETKTTGFYVDAVSIPENARQLRLSLAGKENWVRTLCVYDAQYPDNAVQQWQPVPEKLDLLVFSAHQDDEFLFLGGTIPYACEKGADVALVYMTNGGRSRYTEAMDGLWTAGLRYHPIFMNWRDQKVNSLNIARKTWSQKGVDPQMEVVRLLRKYKPEVVVAQDLEGEYGHTQHKLTSRLVAEAVPLAKDANYDPKSAEEYGTWEVKKLYLHLYGKNQIDMDWDAPFSPDSPISPMFLAKEAFDKHRSQQKAYSMDREAKTYNNRRFGLYYTAVGPDEAKNDFFEHIDLGK